MARRAFGFASPGVVVPATIICAFAALHALATLMAGDWVDVVSAPFQIAAELMAAAVCCRVAAISRPSARPGWIYLGAACALTALNTLACLWVYRVQGASYDFANFSDFLYVFNYIALIWCVLWSEDREAGPAFFWFDVLQAGIALFLGYVLLFNALPFAGPTDPMPVSTLLLSFSSINTALIIMTLVKLVGRVTPLRERAFDSRRTVFMVVFLSVMYVYNYGFGSQPGPQDVLICLPFLILWALTRNLPAEPETSQRPSHFAMVVDSFGPAASTGAVLCLSVLAASPDLPWISFALIAATLPLWALRSAMAQSYLVKIQHDLRAAYATVEQLAVMDGLTGIANRRKFDESLALHIDLARRNRSSLALLMADVDFFKILNDTQGHQAGDTCLIKVAAALEATARRETDLVARYGGEEFAIILPGCNVDQARMMAERMLRAVRALEVPNQSPIGDTVSISVGVAVFEPGSPGDAGDLVEMADIALYCAKENGRNRAHWHQQAQDAGTVPARTASAGHRPKTLVPLDQNLIQRAKMQ